MPSNREVFSRHLERFSLSEDQMAQLVRHYELLLQWNAKINLTRIVEASAACERHFAESLELTAFLAAGATVLDVGSGGGFPGVPLAVARPDLSVHLVESVGKKGLFLREATRNLPQIKVHVQRAEGLTTKFDCVVSRAVAPAVISSLVPSLAPRALMLMSPSDTGSTWNILKHLPRGVVAEFHVKHDRTP